MIAFLNRVLKALHSFFPEILKSISFRPVTPTGRLEFFIHFWLMLFLVVLVSWPIYQNTRNITLVGIIWYLLFLLLCLFPFFRFVLNRVADLRLSFNDDQTLFFTTKKIFITVFSCIVTIKIACGFFKLSDTTLYPFYDSFSYFPRSTSWNVDLFEPANHLSFFLFALAYVFLLPLASSLMFPAKKFNIFENLTFSHKLKDFVFFLIAGILLILCLFFLRNQAECNPLTLTLLAIMSCLALALIVFGKNFYATIRLLAIPLLTLYSIGFLILSPNTDFTSISIAPIFFAVFLLSCRKNFLLTLIPVLSLNLDYQDNQLLTWVFLLCLYLVLIIDYFDFKDKKDSYYSSLWAMCVAGFFVFLTPSLNLPSPTWPFSIPKFMLFALLSGLFMGIIYLNCKIKKNPQYQLIAIASVGVLLYALYPLCLQFPKLVDLFWINYTDFTYIIYALILWIVSNDEKISSAYKLAICSLICTLMLLLPEFSTSLKDFPFLNLFIEYVLLCGNLLLFYFFYKIKSSFKYIALAFLPLNIVALIITVFISNFRMFDDYRSIITSLFWIRYICSFLVFAICCFIFYKLRNSFNADLTLKQ